MKESPIIVRTDEEEVTLRSMYKGQYFREVLVDEEKNITELQERFTRFEYPDPVPVQLPIYLQRPESTDDRIRRLMSEQRAYIAWQMRQEETEEDEFDFDDDGIDPDLPESPYEFTHHASQAIRRGERIRKAKIKRAQKSLPDGSSNANAPSPAEPKPDPSPEPSSADKTA